MYSTRAALQFITELTYISRYIQCFFIFHQITSISVTDAPILVTESSILNNRNDIVTKFLSPTSQNCHHKVTTIRLSPTSLLPDLFFINVTESPMTNCGVSNSKLISLKFSFKFSWSKSHWQAIFLQNWEGLVPIFRSLKSLSRAWMHSGIKIEISE